MTLTTLGHRESCMGLLVICGYGPIREQAKRDRERQRVYIGAAFPKVNFPSSNLARYLITPSFTFKSIVLKKYMLSLPAIIRMKLIGRNQINWGNKQRKPLRIHLMV